MHLHPLSMKKFLKMIFNREPVTFYNYNDAAKKVKLKEMQKDLEEKLKPFQKLTINDLFGERQRPSIALKLAYPCPDTRSWHNEDSIEIFFKGDQLYVGTRTYSFSDREDERPFSNLDQVVAFFEKVDQKRSEYKKNALKRQRIKKLKKEAVLSRIKVLSQELNFKYFISRYELKLKLSVQLDKLHLMEIDIPYNRFQETLTDLEDCIKAVKSFYEQDILRFKIKRYSGQTWD